MYWLVLYPQSAFFPSKLSYVIWNFQKNDEFCLRPRMGWQLQINLILFLINSIIQFSLISNWQSNEIWILRVLLENVIVRFSFKSTLLLHYYYYTTLIHIFFFSKMTQQFIYLIRYVNQELFRGELSKPGTWVQFPHIV